MAFVLQEGGKVSHPRELTAVSDQYVQSHAGPPSFSRRPHPEFIFTLPRRSARHNLPLETHPPNQLQAIVPYVFSIPHLLRNKPVAFVLQEGGKVSHPRELTA
ncbi:hypothetical protein, partial [Pantoea ananatis]|uniref:hypothetical protein n=2 Tax=Pantoea ananas TaxID=553 RepID=UPI001B31781A